MGRSRVEWGEIRSPVIVRGTTEVAHFVSSRPDLGCILVACASGQELIGRGFSTEVDLSSRLDCSTSAPLLRGESYLNVNDVDDVNATR